MATSTIGGGIGPITGQPILSGKGSPEGVYAAPVGTIYRRTDGTFDETLYVKEDTISANDSEGWTPLVTPVPYIPGTLIGSLLYATSTPLTMTLASLASSTTAGWQSTSVDNVALGYVDSMIQVRFKLAAGTPSADQLVYLYLYGSEDGTNYTDAITGTSAALTLRSPTNMILLQTITVQSGGLTHTGQPTSVALAFSGVMPRKWGIVLKNTTGLAFTATASDHSVSYTGIYTYSQ